MKCELCNANPCQCSDKFQETHPEVHEQSTYWWISKFSDEIEALHKEIKELKQLAHNPHPPDKGEQLEKKL